MEFFICAKAKWIANDRMSEESGYNEKYLMKKFDASDESEARNKARLLIQDFESNLPKSDSWHEIRQGDFEIIAFGQVLADP